MAEIKYWLWLSGCTQAGPKARAALAAYYGGAKEAYMAPAGDYASVPGITSQEAQALEDRDLSRAEELLELCRRQGIQPICLEDPRYPQRLKNIFAPPVVLYVKGSLSGLDERAAIAVIGTRKASPYGLKMGRDLAYQLCRGGADVICLLTEGIDRAVAQGALLSGGRVIAVLGSPIPEKLSPMQEDIAACGALVSEYGPGTPVHKSFFRDRNRVASGLSVGLVVVEAPAKSGTLLFAAQALEQGKEIFALPGNADAENSVGTNRLLKEGARPVTQGWDVLEGFQGIYRGISRPEAGLSAPVQREEKEPEEGPAPVEEKPKAGKKEIDKEKPKGYIGLREQLAGLSADQLEIIKAIGPGGVHIDDVIQATGLPAAKVLSQLTLLEIKGYISRGAGKRIRLEVKRR